MDEAAGAVAAEPRASTAATRRGLAETRGQAIVAAAQGIQNQAYPQQSFSSAAYIYCWDGGTTSGASSGSTDPGTDGSYSNCNSIGRVGFDCRGLALYAVYQGTNGAVTLPTSTAGAQYSGASGYGGSYISLSTLQPGDLVFFGSSSSSIDHDGIVVSGTGSTAEIISAVSEGYGITTHTIQWFQAAFSWVGAVSIPGVGSTGGSPLTIPAATWPPAYQGQPYSYSLYATGGTAPYNWQVVSGSLPTGLSLSSNGVISGTPPADGTWTSEISVTDSSSPPQAAAISLAFPINGILTVPAATWPVAYQGQPFSYSLYATGGTTPYNWQLASGSLPPGISLSSSGFISGTPTTVGTWTGQISVTDSSSPSLTATISFMFPVNILQTVPSAPSVVSVLPDDGNVEIWFNEPVSDGGSPIYSYTLTATDVTNPANGGETQSTSSSPSGVSGLTNGDTYTITVTALNAVGASPQSNPSSASTPLASGGSADYALVADTGNNRVYFSCCGGAGTPVVTGLDAPRGVAVDAAGNLFVADTAGNAVLEEPNFGAGSAIALGTGLNGPEGVALDAAGDVFIADTGDNRVVEVPAGGGPQLVIGTGLTGPSGVAVDASGDVFIADTGDNRVVEVPAGGGPQLVIGTGLTGPSGVAVDASGDVFIADTGGNRVVEVPAGGGSQVVIGPTLNGPFGVGVDPAGNVYAIETGYSRVVEIANGGLATAEVNSGAGLAAPTGLALLTTPAAPQVQSATAGNGQATVDMSPQTWTEAAPIATYTVTADDLTHSANGGEIATGTTPAVTVTGLTNGDLYTFTVHAANGAGAGPTSSWAGSVTPLGRPSVPLGVTADPGRAAGQVTLTWKAPSFSGGAPVTSYRIYRGTSPSSLALVKTGVKGTSSTDSGVESSTPEFYALSAVNSVGKGPQSAPVAVMASPGLPTWVDVSGGTSPSLAGATSAYDPATGQYLLVAGFEAGTGAVAGTWVWSGTAWTQLAPTNSPPPRQGATMAWDPATNQLVLFGGIGTTTTLADTWEWNGTNWIQLAPQTSPPGLSGASLSYDTATKQLILFGGVQQSNVFQSETWKWTGTRWTQLFPSTAPPAEVGGTLSYDSASQQMILFGGVAANNAFPSGTWDWTGSTWLQLLPATSPPLRSGASAAYDPDLKAIVMYGGTFTNVATSKTHVFSDTWEWNGGSWKQLKIPAPFPRTGATMAWDAGADQLILYGGFGGPTSSFMLNDTLELAP